MKNNKTIAIDYGLLKVVYEDLKYLTRDWSDKIEDDYLRRGAAVLRQLLIYEKLNTAANMLGIEIKIPCIPYSEDKISKHTKYYAAGGAQSRGCAVSDLTFDDSLPSYGNNEKIDDSNVVHNVKRMINVNGISGAVSLKIRELKSAPVLVPIKLSVYLAEPSFVIEGTKITHEEVIKYVANKKGGGGHYDKNRKNTELAYKLLDDLNNVIANRDAIYYALLSIGRAIVESENVKKLITEIELTLKSSGKGESNYDALVRRL